MLVSIPWVDVGLVNTAIATFKSNMLSKLRLSDLLLGVIVLLDKYYCPTLHDGTVLVTIHNSSYLVKLWC